MEANIQLIRDPRTPEVKLQKQTTVGMTGEG